jgi:hypothetical protein
MMNRSFTFALSSGVLSAALLCLFSLPVSGQTPAEIEALANRTAERVAKTHQQHIFVAGLKECLLDVEVCASFEASFRANIEKMVPGMHFVKRESVINILEGRGFIALDVYIPDVLKAVATSAGADILVTETLEWQSDGYELDSEIYDAAQGKKGEQFRAKIVGPVADSGGDPLVFRDSESGVSLIVPRGKQSRQPGVENVACLRCPEPEYTPEARVNRIQGHVLMLATITEQGMAGQIGIIDGLAGGLTDQAVEALHGWHFKPAMGKDGKPFATRMPVEMMFRLR